MLLVGRLRGGVFWVGASSFLGHVVSACLQVPWLEPSDSGFCQPNLQNIHKLFSTFISPPETTGKPGYRQKSLRVPAFSFLRVYLVWLQRLGGLRNGLQLCFKCCFFFSFCEFCSRGCSGQSTFYSEQWKNQASVSPCCPLLAFQGRPVALLSLCS